MRLLIPETRSPTLRNSEYSSNSNLNPYSSSTPSINRILATLSQPGTVRAELAFGLENRGAGHGVPSGASQDQITVTSGSGANTASGGAYFPDLGTAWPTKAVIRSRACQASAK